MKNNHKKAFSLAEMLILFVLISTMLAAFAPVLTKRAIKKENKSCPTGVKDIVLEYPTYGVYSIVIPENIIGDATVTLVGGGGRGGDAVILELDDEENIVRYRTGGGGGGGAYVSEKVTLLPNSEFNIVVGGGGNNLNNGNGGFSEFSEITSSPSLIKITAYGGSGANGVAGGSNVSPGGQNGESGNEGSSGNKVNAGRGGGNSYFNSSVDYIGGVAGEVCLNYELVCDHHGKQGSSFEQNGNSKTGYVAGFGGGGGGISSYLKSEGAGFGGFGGDGYAKIEYQVRCDY